MSSAALLALSLLAAPEPRAGLERPEAVLTQKLAHEQRGRPGSGAPAVRTCQVFARHAVLSTDEGEIGVADLELRTRRRGATPAEACAERYEGHAVRPTGEAAQNQPVGVVGRLLFTTWVDSFGDLTPFALLDLESGRTVYTDDHVAGLGIEFELAAPAKDVPALTYWSPLRGVACVPRADEAACWARVRADNGIPATVPQPDCEAAIRQEPSIVRVDADRAVQITVHVRVPRLSRGDATVLPERPRCGVTP